MKKTLLLSATAAILAGAFSPAVFADTTSGSTAAASSTPAPSATTAGGSMSAVVATDNVMPIVSGTTNYNFGNINYAWNNGTASLTQGITATGSFSVQNLKTQLDWTLSATYSDSNAVDAHGNQAVVIPNVALKAANLNNYATTTVAAPGATLNLANGTPSFTGTVAYTIAPANVQ